MSVAPENDPVMDSHRVPTRPSLAGLAVSFESIPLLAAIFDVIWVLLLGTGTGLAYHLLIGNGVGDARTYLGLALAAAILFCTITHAAGFYRTLELVRLWTAIRRAVLVWVLVFGCLTAIAFLLKIGLLFSRVTVLLFFSGGICALAVSRVVTAWAVAHVISLGMLAPRRILVIGTASELSSSGFAAMIEPYGYVVSRMFVLHEVGADCDDSCDSLSERMAEIVDYVRASDVDEIILKIPWTATDLMERMGAALEVLPIPVKLMPDSRVGRLVGRPLSELGPTKVIELQRAPLTSAQRVLKYSMDVSLAAIGVLLLLPMLGLLALAVRLETRGPAFFLQSRIGFNGRPFKIFKFRTMSTLEDGPVVVQARRNDPRITPLGRWLRMLSIDELPQLLNVLRGEMSLVGPRPHALAHDDEYGRVIATYAMRRKMKPGLTGWAQINGCRGETPSMASMQRRVELDLRYIESWSLWLDIRIMLTTIGQLLRPRNVY